MSEVTTGEVTPVATPLADGNTAPNAGETVTPAAEQAPIEGEKPATKTFTQEEVDRIAQREREKADRKAQRRADQRIAEIVAQSKPQNTSAAEPGKPNIAQYQTTDAYEAAMEQWAEQRVETKAQERKAQEQAQRTAAEKADAIATFADREDELREKHPDYEQVTRSPRLPMPETMLDAIVLLPNGPELIYHLGKNIPEAARIAALPDALQKVEIGKLAAKIEAAPAPKTQPSKAPEPITPVGGKNVVEKNPNDMTDAEFARWRASHKKRR